MSPSRITFMVSSIIMGIIGISLIFFNNEIAGYLELEHSSELIFHILGASYFGFAMMNWMAKGMLAGGIYGRPIVIGNLSHFLVTSIALLKLSMKDITNIPLLIGALIYVVFCIAFGYLFFNTPKEVAN